MKRIYTPIKKKTILIVDDDQVVVHTYRQKFQSQGFQVEVAGSGARAMQRLKKEPVDLMILDLCMPGMTGVEVLRKIRSDPDMQELPVIVLSNPYLSNSVRAFSEVGATKCVTKAASTPSQILQLVRELLAVDHSYPVRASSDVVSSNASATFAVESETEFQEKKLVAALLINAPETLAKLRTGHQVFARTEPEDLRKAKLSEMHRQVRSLAGPAGLLGFGKIAQMGNALEALLIELRAKPKKITPSVIRTIAQATDTLASLFEGAARSQNEVLVPTRILVVDDEIISRKTICSALGRANLTAVSMDDALAAQRVLEQDHFDLIFLDVEMPGQSGLELCVNIREMPTNRATPVVFVTTHSDFASRAQSTLSGGNDFIAKPFLLIELAVKALTWLLKKGPPLSGVTAQNSSPAQAGSHELQPSASPAAGVFLPVNDAS